MICAVLVEFAFGGFESFVAVEGEEFGDEVVEVSLDHAVEFVEGEVAAVIGESILGEVVGADAFAAVA